MSEANEILKGGARDVRTAFQKARAAKGLEKASRDQPENREVFRRLNRTYRAQAIGSTIGLILAFPLYLIGRTMELVGVLPVLFLLGAGAGLATWVAVGDRASAAEFVGFVIGSGVVIIPCAFIWALAGEGRDDE